MFVQTVEEKSTTDPLVDTQGKIKMDKTKAPKVVLKVGFPIFTIIAGTLLILKVLGLADVSWLLIVGVWLAPLWLVLAFILGVIAFLLLGAAVCAIAFVGWWVWELLFNKT